jgi:hypothetical protein
MHDRCHAQRSVSRLAAENANGSPIGQEESKKLLLQEMES